MNDCIFCKIINGDIPAWKVYEDDNVLAFFDVNPANEYHTLVIPKQHYKNIFDIPENELVHIIKAIKKITTILKEKVGIENVKIVNNAGKEAGQDVFHIHFHIIPRKKGDGQDMSWIPKPELAERYDELLKKLQ